MDLRSTLPEDGWSSRIQTWLDKCDTVRSDCDQLRDKQRLLDTKLLNCNTTSAAHYDTYDKLLSKVDDTSAQLDIAQAALQQLIRTTYYYISCDHRSWYLEHQRVLDRDIQVFVHGRGGPSPQFSAAVMPPFDASANSSIVTAINSSLTAHPFRYRLIYIGVLLCLTDYVSYYSSQLAVACLLFTLVYPF